jgi:zinc transporter ZupT
MSTLLWIILFGFLMSFIALAGALSLFLQPALFQSLITPLVAFSAGSLIGGALFHMIPAAVESMGNVTSLYVWLAAGFVIFYGLEQFLNWHHSHTHSHACPPLRSDHQHYPHTGTVRDEFAQSVTHVCGLDTELGVNSHRPHGRETDDDSCENSGRHESLHLPDGFTRTHIRSESANCLDEEAQCPHVASCKDNLQCTVDTTSAQIPDTLQQTSTVVAATPPIPSKKPLTYLILIADAVHNFLGGMFVGASFVDSVPLGVSAWCAAAAHELPQELGDFAILVHGGWSPMQALLWNFLSALPFLVGGVAAYATSKAVNVDFLVPFAAGNFLYIAGSDLIPEVKHFHGIRANFTHFFSFTAGLGLLLVIRIAYKGW